jgi:L-ascorbate metabolism protein UlaG (beta-lactamase superfamily)
MKIIKVIIASLLLIFITDAQTLSTRTEAGDSEAVIWYLGHCGFAVKTPNHFLIFDYVPWEPVPEKPSLSNGFIMPDEIKDLNILVFVTHSHSDHFNKSIFEWEKQIEKIEYFFGWDVETDISGVNKLIAPLGEYLSDELEVYTINSHHSGVPEVAYLVKVDGLVIYHGGDNRAEYKIDFPYLKTKTDFIDIVFTNSVALEGHHYTLQLFDLIDKFNPKAIYPQHALNEEKEDYNEFKKFYEAKGITTPIICAENRGDSFIYKNGITIKN